MANLAEPSKAGGGSEQIRNIFVTGGAGFIGSHFVRKILSQYSQYNVYVFDKLDYSASIKNLQPCHSAGNFTFIKGDVTTPDFVTFILTEKRIDTIVHFAAQTHVDNSFGDSFEFTQNNILGTHVLLEAARVTGIRRFLHISTDEVYGEANPGSQCREESILAPTNPYAATKAAAECLVMAYQKSFNVPVIITRSNNVYGPFQYPEKVIPKFICSLLKGGKCFIHGDGSHSRRYLYATDAADALDIILHKGQVGQIYNIGSDFEISNLDLARWLLKAFDLRGRDGERYAAKEERWLEFVPDRAYNDQRYAVDSSKLVALGWKPKVSFAEGLKETSELIF
ncbi:hypothetical protein HK104_000486 [Borealophlyctis nickersoniae]|nr:hypothetical protein HK104_000486 [Borealophlyctis nickersoniae]